MLGEKMELFLSKCKKAFDNPERFYSVDGDKIKEWIARETKKIESGSTKIKASEKYKTKNEFKKKITDVWGYQIITNPSNLKSHYERLLQSLSLDFIDDLFLNKEVFNN